ncbi:MAG: hypothetical protein WA792_13930 [Pseudolabrys sp.]
MRHLTASLILTGAILTGTLALGGAAHARDLTFPALNADALKSACATAGGKFSQDSSGYDCGTDCKGGPGTDCVVHCADGQKCTAQVSGGGRRPHSVAAALTKAARHAR